MVWEDEKRTTQVNCHWKSTMKSLLDHMFRIRFRISCATIKRGCRFAGLLFETILSKRNKLYLNSSEMKIRCMSMPGDMACNGISLASILICGGRLAKACSEASFRLLF